METKVYRCFAVFLAIVFLASGCAVVPVISPTGISTPALSSALSVVLTQTPTMTPELSALTTASLGTSSASPEPTPEATPEPTTSKPKETVTSPDPTAKPGLWREVKKNDEKLSENNVTYRVVKRNVKADVDSISSAKKQRAQIGDWTYFFDTKQAVLAGYEEFSDFEFLLCRKKGETVQSLNIYGSIINSGAGYLFLFNNHFFAGESETWDTWMLTPEGKKVAYLGHIYDLLIPEKGGYLYFSDSVELILYRMDIVTKRIGRLNVLLPNRKKLQKEIPNVYFSTIEIKKLDGIWLFFTADIDSFFEKEFIGGYKINITDGKVYQTDDGKWVDYSQGQGE